MTHLTRICSVLIAYEHLRSFGLSRSEAISRSVMAASQAADIKPASVRVITPEARRSDLEVARELGPMLWTGAANRGLVPDPHVVH